jgi:hypothetical protein
MARIYFLVRSAGLRYRSAMIDSLPVFKQISTSVVPNGRRELEDDVDGDESLGQRVYRGFKQTQTLTNLTCTYTCTVQSYGVQCCGELV